MNQEALCKQCSGTLSTMDFLFMQNSVAECHGQITSMPKNRLINVLKGFLLLIPKYNTEWSE